MSPIIGRLLKHNPKLSIKIDYDMGDDLIKSFRKGELDVLILPDTEKMYSTNLEVEKKFLMKEEMWLVGSGKETDMPQNIGVSELGKYPTITFSKEYPEFNAKLAKVCEQANLKLEPAFESTNVGTLKRVIESGLGWGFLPALSIKKQVKMGRMNHVHIRDFSYEVEFFYYYRKGADKLVDVFYQALQSQEKI
jgi:DNA-binding transcriptional LysR family regulator